MECYKFKGEGIREVNVLINYDLMKKDGFKTTS